MDAAKKMIMSRWIEVDPHRAIRVTDGGRYEATLVGDWMALSGEGITVGEALTQLADRLEHLADKIKEKAKIR